MKYKEGDKVRIKSLDWYNENKDEYGTIIFSTESGDYNFTKEDTSFCGRVVTIAYEGKGHYLIAEDDRGYFWIDGMIEGLVNEETKKKLSDESWRYKNVFDPSQYPQSFEVPDGYQFVDENGNVINATKIVLEKKKKEYPKTYEECCKVMNYCCNPVAVKTTHKEELIRKFQFLLMYRDAYWKIAGEERGLLGSWEPQDTNTFSIFYDRLTGKIHKQDGYCGANSTLEFPTEEMRDAFYENFKELIESVKELL